MITQNKTLSSQIHPASFGDQRRRVIWQCYQTWKITFKSVVMMQSLILYPLRLPPCDSTQPHRHHIKEFENERCLTATGYCAELRFCWVTFSLGSFIATSAYSTAFGISNSHFFFFLWTKTCKFPIYGSKQREIYPEYCEFRLLSWTTGTAHCLQTYHDLIECNL